MLNGVVGKVEVIVIVALLMIMVVLPIVMGVKMHCKVGEMKNSVFISLFSAFLSAVIMALLPAGIFLVVELIRLRGLPVLQEWKIFAAIILVGALALWPAMTLKIFRDYMEERRS